MTIAYNGHVLAVVAVFGNEVPTQVGVVVYHQIVLQLDVAPLSLKIVQPNGIIDDVRVALCPVAQG